MGIALGDMKLSAKIFTPSFTKNIWDLPSFSASLEVTCDTDGSLLGCLTSRDLLGKDASKHTNPQSSHTTSQACLDYYI
ncbi:hypothetical protein DEO72_LG11g1161 [Vigna unguiculata]|uniref:Uncharacterized protein n=1 Tax=Vigna unguiculata TaxID=3917 RepID=A0A4D6NK53_VIGUN|nr:hypothetical protein DEO72_LG11g1161 [Vigna unguiculata]